MEPGPEFDRELSAISEMKGVAKAKEVVRFYRRHEADIEEVAKDKPHGQALLWVLSGTVQAINILILPATMTEFLGTNLVDKPLGYASRLKDKIKDSLRK